MSVASNVISVRKRPTQARSKEKVARILDAAAQILIQEGADAITTVRVAEVSGVTVGSIYQYFPNKETILLELYQRWLDDAFHLYLRFSDENANERSPQTYFANLFRTFMDETSNDQHRLSVELINVLRVNKRLQALDLAHDQRLLKAVTSDLRRFGLNKQRIANHRTMFLVELTASLMDMVSRAAPKDRPKVISHSIEVIEKMIG